jgi:membrane associated rhomboid family serine protease
MGIYDRDYFRQERPGISLRAPQTMVVTIIIINAVLWLANGLLTDRTDAITRFLACYGDTLAKPWMWWQFLTYGFAHSRIISHVFFNMLALFFLGREVESHYGRREFLRFYLTALVCGSVTWVVVNRLGGDPDPGQLVGASGAVVAVVILFALNFPHRTILLFFVIPMPAWVLGVMLVAFDLLGALGRTNQAHIAFTVHLTGAAFAALYFYGRWNLGRLIERLPKPRLRRRPRLRIHNPGRDDQDLSREVDRILEKMSREGEASLTRKERRTLEDASRQYRRRRRG